MFILLYSFLPLYFYIGSTLIIYGSALLILIFKKKLQRVWYILIAYAGVILIIKMIVYRMIFASWI